MRRLHVRAQGIFDKEQAGTVMVFCLTIGLTAGVWMGVLLNNWF